MSRELTEEKVLKKLGIENFRYMTKDKVISMASMLDQMDPEVAKKAIEQFPEFSKTVKEMLLGYKETLDNGLESNKENVQTYYKICQSVIASLENLLLNEDITFEERKYIIEKILEVSRMVGEKDAEDKKFIKTMSTIGLVALGVASVALSTALGGKAKIDLNK